MGIMLLLDVNHTWNIYALSLLESTAMKTFLDMGTYNYKLSSSERKKRGTVRDEHLYVILELDLPVKKVS